MILASSLFVGNPTIELESVDSTNDYASKLIVEDQVTDGYVISAKHQTKGKGQFGSTWLTRPEQNLTLSIILKPKNLHIKHQFYLSVITSIAIRDVVAKYGITTHVKWPNDIYVKSNKICGILIQNTLQQSLIQYSIIGIGLNVNQHIFDPSLPNPTSILNETNKTHSLLDIRQELYNSFESYYIDLKHGEFDNLLTTYRQHLYQKNEVRSYKLEDGEIINGIIRNVQENGKLEIELENGIQEFSLKEISFV